MLSLSDWGNLSSLLAYFLVKEVNCLFLVFFAELRILALDLNAWDLDDFVHEIFMFRKSHQPSVDLDNPEIREKYIKSLNTEQYTMFKKQMSKSSKHTKH